MTKPLVRIAVPDDSRAIAELAERTFRETFSSTNSAENMELHCRASFGETIQRAEISSVEMVTLICEEAAGAVGFAQLHFGEPPDCVAAAAPGEIHRLYVLGDRHGKGVGHALMSACLEELRRRKADVAWLGVWERNSRALAFYAKHAFVPVGEHVFQLGADPQRDLLLARAVSEAERGA